IGDLLPNASLIKQDWSVRENRLASLPVMLVPGSLSGSDARAAFRRVRSDDSDGVPLLAILLAAWGATGLAIVALSVSLHSAMTLSERRAAFVSAVTHELRTPLTTVRMYSEMLANGMVKEDGQRADYHATLHREAERLSHLVDNVLAYSRLEKRGPARPMTYMTVGELLERCAPRLEERALAGEMVLDLDRNSALSELRIRTDPGAVEQILFNLVDNACKYGGDGLARTLRIDAQSWRGKIAVSVADDGKGLPADVRTRLFEPFSKSSEEAAATAPGVGLGLALSRQLARELGGDLRYDPASKGARFVLLLASA
ncbi:MAG: sensor histidine kinase, partial [Myxococcaceae bacterium]